MNKPTLWRLADSGGYYCEMPGLVETSREVDRAANMNRAGVTIHFGSQRPPRARRQSRLRPHIPIDMRVVGGNAAFAYEIHLDTFDPSLVLSAAEYIGGIRVGSGRRLLRPYSYDVGSSPRWNTSSVLLHGTAPFANPADLDEIVHAYADSLKSPKLDECENAIRAASLTMDAVWAWPSADWVELAAGWLGSGGKIRHLPMQVEANAKDLARTLAASVTTSLR